MERHGAQYGIEGVAVVGECFFVGENFSRDGKVVVEREVCIAVEEDGGGVDGSEMFDS